MTRPMQVWRAADYSPELAVVGLTTMSMINAIFIWLFTSQRPQRQVLSEVNRLLPQFDVHVVKFPFVDTSHFDDELEKVVGSSMDIWENVMPTGGGFIIIDDFNKTIEDRPSPQLPQKVNLPPEYGPETSYGISVFHQLHCLHSLQTSFNIAVSNSSSLQDFGRHRLLHTYHCFDFIRRALMCAADTALEGQTSTTDKAATLGEGSYHLCRDFEAVKAYAVEHRLSDSESDSFLDD